jgi:hypothetical protein
MATDAMDPPEPNAAAEPAEDADEFLAKADEKFKQLDDEIREAERKSKEVIPDPET